MGLGGLEPPTSRLSGVRSDQAELQALTFKEQKGKRGAYPFHNDLSEPDSDTELFISSLERR